jgi:hypothetical protein
VTPNSDLITLRAIPWAVTWESKCLPEETGVHVPTGLKGEIRDIYLHDPNSQPPKSHNILMSLIGGVMWVAVVHNTNKSSSVFRPLLKLEFKSETKMPFA